MQELISGWDRQNVRQKRLIPLYSRLFRLGYNSASFGTVPFAHPTNEKILRFNLHGKKLPKKTITFAAGTATSNIKYYMWLEAPGVTGNVHFSAITRMTWTDV